MFGAYRYADRWSDGPYHAAFAPTLPLVSWDLPRPPRGHIPSITSRTMDTHSRRRQGSPQSDTTSLRLIS